MNSVQFSAEAETALQQFREQSGRSDEVVDGLLLDLRQRPTAYEEVPQSGGLRCAETRPFPDVPLVRVYFRVIDGECRVERIKWIEDAPG